MILKVFLATFFSFFVFSQPNQTNYLIHPDEKNIKTRFSPPKNFKRITVPKNSFGSYLRNLKLKKHNELVKYYDGSTKPKNNIYCAVVDQKISNRDLQQCADAVMRLRGEYLFSIKEYNDIHFNFLRDHKPRYYKDYTKDLSNYNRFLSYMDWVFAFANTESLANELHAKSIQNISIGDVFIHVNVGNIGHAVIVVDVAINQLGERMFILAQSYMPAQETQILINPNSQNSPWFSNQDEIINTPEWTFYPTQLMSFKD